MSRICQPDFVWNYDRHGEYRHYATLARQGNLKSMQRFLLGISGTRQQVEHSAAYLRSTVYSSIYAHICQVIIGDGNNDI